MNRTPIPTDSVEWREIVLTQRAVFLLPEATSEPLTCYIRLDGLPGLWFEPMLRTPQDAANNWAAFRAQRPFWPWPWSCCSAFCAAFPRKASGACGRPCTWPLPWRRPSWACPPTARRITMMEAAAVLSPGVALMLLPHVGRHLLRAKQRSRLLDAQFVLPPCRERPWRCCLSCPASPDHTLSGPVAHVHPDLCAQRHWRRHHGPWRGTALSLGCLLPPLFVTAGVMGLDSGYAANLMASAPLWGTALSALIIAGTGGRATWPRAALTNADERRAKDGSLPGPDGFGGLGGLGGPAMPDFSPDFSGNGAALMMEDGAINLDQPLDDPTQVPAAAHESHWRQCLEPVAGKRAPARASGAETSAETSRDGAATARQQSGASATNGGSGFGRRLAFACGKTPCARPLIASCAKARCSGQLRPAPGSAPACRKHAQGRIRSGPCDR